MNSIANNFWKIATALEEKFGVFHLFHFIEQNLLTQLCDNSMSFLNKYHKLFFSLANPQNV